MSEIKIRRRVRSLPITLHSTTTLATTLRMGDFAGAAISLGTISSNAATLQVFGANEEDGPFRRIYTDGGSAADITLGGQSTEARIYSLPDAVFAVPYVKLLSGTTNSTGATAIVMFKS
jgi:hypothetical protein